MSLIYSASIFNLIILFFTGNQRK